MESPHLSSISPGGSDGKESAGVEGDSGSVSGWEDSLK